MSRANGKTNTEKLLADIATKSFLNLWCYPNPYINKANRELCDLLVICDKHVVIFSDKSCAFPNEGDIKINWGRWFNKTIKKSTNQLLGAERFLRMYPNAIYLDENCQTKLPIPDPEKDCKIHLIAVANGATQHCQNYFSGKSTGSLLFSSSVFNPDSPFIIGDIKPNGPFIHVLDEYTLPILIQELNTITDFISYLEEKENFLRSGKQVIYSGEEGLLAHYIAGYDENTRKHTFISSKQSKLLEDINNIIIDSGQWTDINNHPTYISKREADQISYLWDNLINQFTKHNIAKTSNTYGRSSKEHEGGFRYMALEPRFYRRILSKLLFDAIESYTGSPNDGLAKITILPFSNQAGLIYLFIQFPFNKTKFDNYEQYCEERLMYLYKACMATKAVLPSLKNISITKVIGVTFEPPKHVLKDINSESIICLFCDKWTEKQQADGELFHNELDLFASKKMIINQLTEKNFPDTK